jgi:hypothetical protein
LAARIAIVSVALAFGEQQVPDRLFVPIVKAPAFDREQGPMVCVDEAHANYHTLDSGFLTFGELLRRDGYAVRALTAPFAAAIPADCRIIVIANARPRADAWLKNSRPTPSAFADAEIKTVHDWVARGGALLLIADHMPHGGAASAVAAAFNVSFTDGFALDQFDGNADRQRAFDKPTVFRIEDKTLAVHAIVAGRGPAEAVTSVRSFTGQAFQALEAEPILILPPTFVTLLPDKPWQFTEQTPRTSAGGWLQGAVKRVGQGRAAFFGEAAMFSAQVTGSQQIPAGMNAPGAEQNLQFVLNVVHWLSGLLN